MQPRSTASAPPPPRVQPAPRPIQTAQPGYAPPPRPQFASQQQPGAPMQISHVPRPPGGIGAGGAPDPRPQQTAQNGNGNAVGTFFSNLFGQR
jgi:hypothetical protein